MRRVVKSRGFLAAHHLSIVDHFVPGSKKETQICILTLEWQSFDFLFRPEIDHHFEICCKLFIVVAIEFQIFESESQTRGISSQKSRMEIQPTNQYFVEFVGKQHVGLTRVENGNNDISVSFGVDFQNGFFVVGREKCQRCIIR